MRTEYLGQFTIETANAVAQQLEAAGIEWWHKQSGSIARVLFRGDWGVRIFVDAQRLDEAAEIARAVARPEG